MESAVIKGLSRASLPQTACPFSWRKASVHLSHVSSDLWCLVVLHYCLLKLQWKQKHIFFFLSWGVLCVELNCFLLLNPKKGWTAENNVIQTHTCDRGANAAQIFFLLHNAAAHLHPVSNFKPCSTFSDWCILPRRLLPRQHKNERRGLWLHDNWLPPPTTSFGLLYCLPQGSAAYW